MSQKMYIGIDLGTSNSSLSFYSDTQLQTLEVEQLESSSSSTKKKNLDSCLYIPRQGEFTDGGIKLSWGEQENIVGEFARSQGASNPDRLVSSAKSWLCQPRVKRDDKILPWKSNIEEKFSPIEASSLYLEHLLKASAQDIPQQLTITVPASFHT